MRFISRPLIKLWEEKSIKAGLLWVQESRLSISPWSEKPVLLTKVGLILFDSIKSENSHFLPILNAKVCPSANLTVHSELPSSGKLKKKGQRYYELKIEQAGEAVALLYRSEEERDIWVKLIQQSQKLNEEEENEFVKIN